jgi:hypothetical protein
MTTRKAHKSACQYAQCVSLKAKMTDVALVSLFQPPSSTIPLDHVTYTEMARHTERSSRELTREMVNATRS